MQSTAGQRIEVLLHRGQADVWYPGTVLEDGSVQLDDYPDGPIVYSDDIAEQRPADQHHDRFRNLPEHEEAPLNTKPPAG